MELLADETEIWLEQIMQHREPWFELLTIDVRKPQLQGFKKGVLFYQIQVLGK